MPAKATSFFEAVDVSDLAQDDRARCGADARNRENDRVQLLQLSGEFFVDLADLPFSELDLLDKDLQLESEGVLTESHSDGTSRKRFDLVGLFRAVSPSARLSQQRGQRLRIEFQCLFRRSAGFEKGLGAFTEHIGKERVVLGKDLVQNGDDLTLVVGAAVLERFAETGQIAERENILVGQTGLGKLAESHDLCDEKAVDRVRFHLSDMKVPETVGLNRIDDMKPEAMSVQEGIQGKPVVPRGFHSDAQILVLSDFLFEEPQQRGEPFLIVGEPKGFSPVGAILVDESGFVIVSPDIDSKIQHDAHSIQ
jgi:hypothetical protein